MLSRDLEPRHERAGESVAFACSGLASIAMLLWLLAYCDYGINFTDESWYLLWIADPWRHDVSVTHFGFVYHPFFRLVGGDIGWLRRCNVLLTFALGFWASWVAISGSALQQTKTWMRVAISGAFASSALTVFAYWLVTPNYNTLVLQAAFLMLIGMVWVRHQTMRRNIVGAALIGVAGWLAFMAKASSAAALAPLLVGYLVAVRVFHVRLWLTGLGVPVALLLCSALAIDGSIAEFVVRFSNGLEETRILRGASGVLSLVRLGRVWLEDSEKLLLIGGTVAVAVSTLRMNSGAGWSRVVVLALCCVGSLLTLFVVPGTLQLDVFQGAYRSAQYWAVAVGISVSTMWLARHELRKLFRPGHLALPIIAAALPLALAFGSNNNYWMMTTHWSVLWVLAGVWFVRDSPPVEVSLPALLPAAVYSQVLTAVLLAGGLANPYRQPQPLRLNTESVQFGPHGDPLVLDETFATYVADWKALAHESGFEPGMVLLDLSGYSPGVVYALDAVPLGPPWTLGGYAGSDDALAFSLGLVSCEQFHQAWLLSEPEGPQALSPDVLALHGLDIERDYERVGSVRSPQMWIREPQGQVLLKPKATPAHVRHACSGSADSVVN